MNHKIFKTLLKSDFYAFMQKCFLEVDNSQEFVSNWHLEVICDLLQQCAKGECKRLIINIPPRSLKSHCCSIAYPAWLLAQNPSERIICVSYSEEISNKFSRDCRKVMNSDFYRSLYGEVLNPNKQAEDFLESNQNGYRYAVSVGGSLTGMGGNFIIIDDPLSVGMSCSETKRTSVNEWYNNTLLSRLNNKKDGVIIVIMQRLHVDDLTNHLLKQEGWKLLSLPAIAEQDEKFILSDGTVLKREIGQALNPKIKPIESLVRQKELMSDYNFSAQYQQRPIPEKGQIIKFDKIKTYNDIRSLNREESFVVLQSWDIALCTGEKNDYSVCITAILQSECLYITNVSRVKLDSPDLLAEIKRQFNLYKPKSLIIESSTASRHLIDFLKSDKIYPIEFTPTENKIVRAHNSTFFINAGRLFIPDNASWIDDFRSELTAFPKGFHDDQVDALTQLILTVMNGTNSQHDILMKAIEKITIAKRTGEYYQRKDFYY